MLPSIPDGWTSPLSAESAKPYYLELQRFLDRERQTQTIFPPEPDVFSALALTPLDRVRVLILGQDPYPGEGLADGARFFVAESFDGSLGDLGEMQVVECFWRFLFHGPVDGWCSGQVQAVAISFVLD